MRPDRERGRGETRDPAGQGSGADRGSGIQEGDCAGRRAAGAGDGCGEGYRLTKAAWIERRCQRRAGAAELTVTLALVDPLGGVSLDVTLAMVLVLVPVVVAVTLIVITHVPLDARVPPASERLPLAAVAVAVPLQLLLSAFGVATTRPAGRLSAKAKPATAKVALGLLIVTVSEVVPPTGIVAAPNACVTWRGTSELTVMVAVAELPVPPLVEVTGEVELFFVPEVVPVTLTENAHDALAAIVAPDKLAEPDPAVAVMVPPPHDPVSPLGVETTRPAGSVSLNATPVRAVEAFGLVMVNDSEVVPPTEIDAAPNALEMVGAVGALTVMLAVVVLPVPPLVEVTVVELF